MSKNDKEKLVDTVMGEAILTLLESADDISFDALIVQLQENLRTETDSERQEAWRSAISGVHHFRTQPENSKKSAWSLQTTQRKNRLRGDTLLNINKAIKH